MFCADAGCHVEDLHWEGWRKRVKGVTCCQHAIDHDN